MADAVSWNMPGAVPRATIVADELPGGMVTLVVGFEPQLAMWKVLVVPPPVEKLTVVSMLTGDGRFWASRVSTVIEEEQL